jgi:hypothetical protein
MDEDAKLLTLIESSLTPKVVLVWLAEVAHYNDLQKFTEYLYLQCPHAIVLWIMLDFS